MAEFHRRTRLSSCAGKERFESYDLAATVARRQADRHHGRYSAYKCTFCGGFHTGTRIEPKGNRRRPRPA